MKKRVLGIMMAVMVGMVTMGCGKDVNNTVGNEVEETVSIGSAIEAMNNIWDNYEGEKFSIMGGDYANMTDGVPGAMLVADDPATDEDESAAIKFLVLVPEDQIAKVDDGASMVHAMNQNTFTAGVFHLVNAEDKEAFAKAYVENAQNNMWMCGIPDRVVVMSLNDSYVLTLFGADDILKECQNTATTLYPGAKIVAEGVIGQ
ncbi:MAG: hypothetical protein MJ105_00270 [Lachnospiraceae bacterium]|nr:hypothetical protein [Lachnospiraceae bacterium]